MTLFVIIVICSVFVDIYFNKTVKTKNDVIYYVVCFIIVAGLAIYYYSDPFRIGIAEYVLSMLNIGGAK